jgi:hypothetical protein
VILSCPPHDGMLRLPPAIMAPSPWCPKRTRPTGMEGGAWRVGSSRNVRTPWVGGEAVRWADAGEAVRLSGL